jgi:hypothetical protein
LGCKKRISSRQSDGHNLVQLSQMQEKIHCLARGKLAAIVALLAVYKRHSFSKINICVVKSVFLEKN